jgi:anti-sigma factor RsiW
MKYETPISKADLHAYVDGQLDARRRQQVEAWLAEHPEEQKELHDYRLLNEGIGKLFEKDVTAPLPEALATAGRRQTIRWAATIAMFAVGMTLGWGLRDTTQNTDNGLINTHLARPAAFAHMVYATDQTRPVEINAGEEQRLINWLSDRLHTEIRAPNLAEFGYELIGGRLLPSTDRMAAQFMYQNVADHRVTLYIRRIVDIHADPTFNYARDGNVRTFYWVNGPLGYALSGDLSKQSLLGLAESIHRQLML